MRVHGVRMFKHTFIMRTHLFLANKREKTCERKLFSFDLLYGAHISPLIDYPISSDKRHCISNSPMCLMFCPPLKWPRSQYTDRFSFCPFIRLLLAF